MNEILDSALYVRHQAIPTKKENQALQFDRSKMAHLLNQLLIYDRVIIPTEDYGAIQALATWLRVEVLAELLENGSLQFARKSGFGYQGNGWNINRYKIMPPPEAKISVPWWGEAHYADDARAVELQVSHCKPFIPSSWRARIESAIMKATLSRDLDREEFKAGVADETMKDVMQDETLQRMIWDLSPGAPSRIELNEMPQVGPNELRKFGGEIKDGVDLLLRLAEINYDFLIASEYDIQNVATPEDVSFFLKAKFGRIKDTNVLNEGFEKIVNLEGLPDIGKAVADKQFDLSDYLQLREGKRAKQFRDWVNKADPSDARNLEQIYHAACNESGLSGNFAVKAARFLITTLIGLIPGINAAYGVAASATDSFVIDKMLSGFTPKLFLDEARKLTKSE